MLIVWITNLLFHLKTKKTWSLVSTTAYVHKNKILEGHNFFFEKALYSYLSSLKVVQSVFCLIANTNVIWI